MNHDLFPQHWLINTLLDDGFIAQKAAELAAQPPVCAGALADWLAAYFKPTKFRHELRTSTLIN
jgi:hypothetical protein